MIIQFFVPLFLATILTLLITPLSIKIAKRFKLIDVPHSEPHKMHQRPVPRAGGLAIGLIVFALFLLSGKLLAPDLRAILLSSVVIFLFGLLDDIKGLSAGWKLVGQLIAGILLIQQDIQIRMFLNNALNLSITLLWIVGITNAFNLVDSMDSLAVGLAAIASAFFMLVTVDAGQLNLTYLSAILLGCCIGLFYFNVIPAQTFLGDSGAQFLGFLLAALSIAYTPPNLPQTSSWFVPILLLSVPIFDTTFVVLSRLQQRKPIYQAGQDHTYHQLVRMGMSPIRAVTTMHVAAFLASCLAFIALPRPPLWANTLFAFSLICGLFVLLWLVRATKNKQAQD